MAAPADAPYLVEPAKSGRSTCKASKLPIEKGELRFGSFIDMGGHGSYAWRKLDYITAKQVANVDTKMGGIAHVGGYAELTSKQQKQLEKAFAKAMKTGAAKDKAKAKVVADKDKAKASKFKAKVAKAKAMAKLKEIKEKAKAKKLAKSGGKATKPVATAAPKAAPKAAVKVEAPTLKRKGSAVTPSRSAPGASSKAPIAEQHKFLDAAKISDFKTVREMLEATPDLINVQPAGRWSALHQAAANNKPTAVKMLLAKGAFTALLTKDKQTPQDVAHAGCKALVALPEAKRTRS